MRASLRGKRPDSSSTELVAAEPVGRAVARRPLDEGRSEPREHHVAGAVTEAVVVALEAVEIEEGERRGLVRRGPREAASSRSSISRRRLPRPVSASVTAVVRLAPEHPRVLEVGERRPRADGEAARRSRGRPRACVSGCAAALTSRPSATRPKNDRDDDGGHGRRPGRCLTRGAGCHAASARIAIEAGHIVSRMRPATYVPLASW